MGAKQTASYSVYKLPPGSRERVSCPYFSGLPLFWTSASKRDFQLADVVRLLSRNTAQLSSLGNLKGSLAPGFDADLVIWDPESGFQVSVRYSHC